LGFKCDDELDRQRMHIYDLSKPKKGWHLKLKSLRKKANDP